MVTQKVKISINQLYSTLADTDANETITEYAMLDSEKEQTESLSSVEQTAVPSQNISND